MRGEIVSTSIYSISARLSGKGVISLLGRSCLGRAAEDDEREQSCYAERGNSGRHRNGGRGAAEAPPWRRQWAHWALQPAQPYRPAPPRPPLLRSPPRR